MTLFPVSIYYAFRIVNVLLSAKFEFVYQIFVSIYMVTLLLVVVQIQYFIKTKNDVEHGSSFGYLWPTKLLSLIVIVCTFTYFALTMVSICQCRSGSKRAEYKKYFVGNLWFLALFVIICVAQIFVTSQMDKFWEELQDAKNSGI